MIISVTGHRPQDLGGYQIIPQLYRFAETMLAISTKPEYFITGMALGWDQAIAEACIKLNIPFVAYIPFPGQESRWPAQAQTRYNQILYLAKEVYCVSESYSPATMQERNKAMVNSSDMLVALYNPEKGFGGTYNCMQYAKQIPDYKIVNLWDRWKKY